jgi:hypothetical protein
MMTAVDVAERRARYRAFGFLFLAALTCAVMVFVRTGRGTDFTQGLWFGLLLGCVLNLLPIKRWLRPRSEVMRLLDDEGTRANRQLDRQQRRGGEHAVLDRVDRLAADSDQLGQRRLRQRRFVALALDPVGEALKVPVEELFWIER